MHDSNRTHLSKFINNKLPCSSQTIKPYFGKTELNDLIIIAALLLKNADMLTMLNGFVPVQVSSFLHTTLFHHK